MSENPPNWPSEDPPDTTSPSAPPPGAEPPQSSASAPPPPPPPSAHEGAPGGAPDGAWSSPQSSGQFGGLGKRFLARIIDGLIIGIPVAIILIFGLNLSAQGFLYTALTSLINLGYFIWLETSQGGTIGKRLLGMKVTDEAGAAITPEQSFKRNWWLLLSIIPVIGGLAGLGVAIYIAVTISSDNRNQGFHDKMANALVYES